MQSCREGNKKPVELAKGGKSKVPTIEIEVVIAECKLACNDVVRYFAPPNRRSRWLNSGRWTGSTKGSTGLVVDLSEEQ